MGDKFPERVAFIFNQNDGLELTFSDIKQKSSCFAQNLITMGLKKGDRISFLLPNTYELVICYMASALAGLVVVPLDQDYGSFELEYMIKKTEPTAIVVYNSNEFTKNIQELFPGIEKSLDKSGDYYTEKFELLKHFIFLKSSGIPIKDTYRNVWDYSELENQRLNVDKIHDFPFVDPDHPYAIMFTSGTTSRPKGVVLNQFSYINTNNMSTVKVFSQTIASTENRNKICFTFLMYHSAALTTIIGTLLNEHNPPIIVFPSLKFNTDAILESIEKYKCSSLCGLPKIILNIIESSLNKSYDLSSLKHIMSGGQQITSDLIQRARRDLKALRFTMAYGSTETCNGLVESYDLTQFNPDTYGNSVGRPPVFFECKIVDPNSGEIQKLNKEGVLCLRGYSITKGYWRDEEQTKKAIDANGWYNTGDYMSMDENGKLYFKSRCKELITAAGSGRLDVFPTEIEDVLLKHENVSEAIAFGISINTYEQLVCAWVKLKPGSDETTSQELIEFCQKSLVDFKVPKHVKIVQTFPINNMGKYMRREMEQIYKKELGDRKSVV